MNVTYFQTNEIVTASPKRVKKNTKIFLKPLFLGYKSHLQP